MPVSVREVYDAMLLGMVSTLEKRSGVGDIKLLELPPATPERIAAWEREFGVSLPSDVRDLLCVSDGLHVVWSARMPGGGLADLGCMHVHGLDQMKTIDCPRVDPHRTNNDDGTVGTNPHAAREGHDGDVVEIDHCGGAGTVALVLSRSGDSFAAVSVRRGDGVGGGGGGGGGGGDSGARPGEVWFADRCGTWHFVAGSFSEYVKLMAVHLGLPGWQYAFTPTGLSPFSEQWFSVYAPVRLEMIRSASDVSFDALLCTPATAFTSSTPLQDESRHSSRQNRVNAEKILALVSEAA